MSRRHLWHWLRILGPGVITGAADDDPSGIATYAIAGASSGYSMLWVALITTPMQAAVQGMCARIGIVSGGGLLAAMRTIVPQWLLTLLAVMVVAANTFNIGADIAGMSASARMLLGLPVHLWVLIFGLLVLVGPIALSYRKFSRISLALCTTLFAYVITAFVVHPNWPLVALRTIVPEFRLQTSWIITFTGFLGTTITPYLFFWQSAMAVEEKKVLSKRGQAPHTVTRQEIADANIDVNTGMIFSNLIAFFIVVTTATTLGVQGHLVTTAQDAAEALRPLAGKFAYLLFAFGIIGTGLLAIPVLAGSSAYVLAETFNFRQGLDEKPVRAPGFYGTIVIGVAVGALIHFLPVDPMQTLLWSSVLNALVAVPLLIVIMMVANRKSVMGIWTNSRVTNLWAALAIVMLAAAGLSLFVFWGKT